MGALGQGLLLPGVACFAGLLLSLVAFGELPLLGALVGALLSGSVAGLLAEEPRDAARAGFAAGAGAVAVLALLALAGPAVFQGSPLLPLPGAVVLAQAALLGLVPGCAAAVVARVVPRARVAAPPPLVPEPPEPPRSR